MKVIALLCLVVAVIGQSEDAQLTAERLWEFLDVDGNGSITLQEMKDRFSAADLDGDGRLDYDEFSPGFWVVTGLCDRGLQWKFNRFASLTDASYPNTDTNYIEEGNIEVAFRQLDADNDNLVSREEFLPNYAQLHDEMLGQISACEIFPLDLPQ